MSTIEGIHTNQRASTRPGLNKDVPRRAFEEIVIHGDLSVLDDILASDFIGHDLTDGTFDREAFRQGVSEVIHGFSDRRLSIKDQLVDGDKVITRWTMTGTHSGLFRGMDATGRSITLSGISIDRIAGGKIVESWEISDDAGLLRQFGQVEEPAVVTGSRDR